MAAESTSTTPAENGESTQQRKLVSKSAEKPRISASDDLQTVGEDVDEADIISEMRNATIPPSVLLDQERYLPIANVVRIMKTQMDPQAKLAKDAKECVQECVSEFISFIAAEAAELCHNMKRKTITADDLLTALEATGFDNYAEPMRVFLMKYRQAHKVTGPIHKPHANYNRPKHFSDDQPLRPLFFDTAQGRRCTETQYVINGCEVAKNAPLADEWNEQTGTLNTPPVAPNPPLIHHQIPGFHSGATKVVQRAQLPPSIKPAAPITSGAPLRIISANDVTGIPEGAIALEQQQQMQIYIDPQSRQHYAVMESGNGLELFPVEIQDRPLQLENVNMPSTMPEMDAAENKFVKLTVSPTFGDIIRMTGCCEKYCTLMIKPVEILAIRKVFVDLFDEMFDGNRKKRGEVHRFFLRALDNKREADGTIRVPGIRNLVCPKVAAAIVGVPLNMLLSYTAKPNEKTCCDCGCRV